MTRYNEDLHCNRSCGTPPPTLSTKTQPLPLFPNQQPRSLCAAESYVSLKLLCVNNISTELQEKASNLAHLVNTVIHHSENTKDPPDSLLFSFCFSLLSCCSSHFLSSTVPPPLLLNFHSISLPSSPLLLYVLLYALFLSQSFLSKR